MSEELKEGQCPYCGEINVDVICGCQSGLRALEGEMVDKIKAIVRYEDKKQADLQSRLTAAEKRVEGLEGALNWLKDRCPCDDYTDDEECKNQNCPKMRVIKIALKG